MRASAWWVCVLCPLLGAGAIAVEHTHPAPVVLAPGYADLEFVPPKPGSYQLPVLGRAADGPVLDAGGRSRSLHELFARKIVVLSFIYTSCSDVNGCPLATHVLKGLQGRVEQDPALRDVVRLVSFSFDPLRDTPETLAAYSKHVRQPEFDWQFVTSQNEAQLQPVLESYDQWVIKDPEGTMSHLLRVYLIDGQQQLRNIYSVSFLHADSVVNDIYTLLAEQALEAESAG